MDYAKFLERLARDFSSAEQKIVEAYFEQPRTRAEHIHWLKAQAFKEYSAIRPIVKALDKLYPRLDKQVDRHDYEELCEKLADETAARSDPEMPRRVRLIKRECFSSNLEGTQWQRTGSKL
jgi:hypothetical protein